MHWRKDKVSKTSSGAKAGVVFRLQVVNAEKGEEGVSWGLIFGGTRSSSA